MEANRFVLSRGCIALRSSKSFKSVVCVEVGRLLRATTVIQASYSRRYRYTGRKPRYVHAYCMGSNTQVLRSAAIGQRSPARPPPARSLRQNARDSDVQTISDWYYEIFDDKIRWPSCNTFKVNDMIWQCTFSNVSPGAGVFVISQLQGKLKVAC